MMSIQLSSNDLTPCYARDQSPLCALEGPRNKDYLLAPNLRKIAPSDDCTWTYSAKNSIYRNIVKWLIRRLGLEPTCMDPGGAVT